MVSIKSLKEIKIMAKGGERLARVLNIVAGEAIEGTLVKCLDKLAGNLILAMKDECSFKGYEGYPNCLCISINDEVVHALPGDKILQVGDIVSLDLGLKHKGYHSDMAVTVPVGRVSPRVKKLIKVTEEALFAGIAEVKVGNYIGDVSRAIQKYVERAGFNIVRELCGHGIGKELHEAPLILNYVSLEKHMVDQVGYEGDANIKIKEGMVLCLEPIVSMGDWRVRSMADGFGYETVDGSWTSHFEHTVAVLKGGAKILTMLK